MGGADRFLFKVPKALFQKKYLEYTKTLKEEQWRE